MSKEISWADRDTLPNGSVLQKAYYDGRDDVPRPSLFKYNNNWWYAADAFRGGMIPADGSWANTNFKVLTDYLAKAPGGINFTIEKVKVGRGKRPARQRTRMPNKTELIKFCIYLQDNCDLNAAVKATQFLHEHKLAGVGSIHQKLTGNPDSAYKN